jgi:hypothetical protein
MSIVKAVLTGNNQRLEVQFNPETLTIEHESYGEQGRQRAGQEAARGGKDEAGQASVKTGFSTSLSQVKLLFDTSDSGEDVRNKTLILLEMMKPDAENNSPLVKFQWGTLIFNIHISGFTEELTYFSEQGVPLRASVNLRMTTASAERSANKISSQNSGLGLSASASISASAGVSASAGFSAGASAGFSAGASAGASVGASVSAGLSAGASIGTTPLSFSQGGQSLQSMSAQAGVDWKVVAEANNIDNPRLLEAGAVVNLNVG